MCRRRSRAVERRRLPARGPGNPPVRIGSRGPQHRAGPAAAAAPRAAPRRRLLGLLKEHRLAGHDHSHGGHSHGSHGHGGHAHGGHAHGGHGHAPKNFGPAFAIGIALNSAFVVVEAAYGYLSNSMSLVADAGHNLSDVLGLAAALVAAILGRRRAPPRFTSGYPGSPTPG